MFEGFFLSKPLEKSKVLRWHSWFEGAEMHHVQMIVHDCHLQVHELIIITDRRASGFFCTYFTISGPFSDVYQGTSIAKSFATQ